jgi:bifunctional enzyme CysN/CysC
MRTRSPLPFDSYKESPVTGRFVIVDGYDVSGGGIITEAVAEPVAGLRDQARRRDLSWVKGTIGADERAQAYGHRSAMVLLTGEAQAYQRSLARHLEASLLADGRRVYLLDPENLKFGLDADISPLPLGEGQGEGPSEALRRFGEVARILLDAGLIVIAPAPGVGPEVQQAVQALLHPVPLLAVRVEDSQESLEGDLTLSPQLQLTDAAERITEALAAEHLFTSEPAEDRPSRYPRYSI